MATLHKQMHMPAMVELKSEELSEHKHHTISMLNQHAGDETAKIAGAESQN